MLVVNGPLRDQMWSFGDRLLPARDVRGFLAWYEKWLDHWLAPGAIDRWANIGRR